MKFNLVGAFVRNHPFGSEIAYKKGLEKLGHEVATFDQITGTKEELEESFFDDADATIIFKHAKGFEDEMKALNGPKIVYQPDDSRCPGVRDMLVGTREYCDYAFTFDKFGAEECKRIGYVKSKKLKLTADPDIYFPIDNVDQDIDFLFIGNMSNPEAHKSRRKMVDVLRKAGATVEAGTIMDVSIVNVMYNRAKIILNHATDIGQEFGTGYGLQCRHFEAGLTKTAVLSNSLLDEEADGLKQFCTFDNEEELLEVAYTLLEGWYDAPLWMAQGEELYKEIMDAHLPEHRAADIIKFVESL